MDIHINSVNAAYSSKLYNANSSEKRSIRDTQKNSSKNETVQISVKSSELQMVKVEIDSIPDVRLKVVDEIKARIKSNDYPFENNLDAIVGQLINSKVI